MTATLIFSAVVHFAVGVYVLFAPPSSPAHRPYVLDIKFIEPKDDNLVVSQMPPSLPMTQPVQRPIVPPPPVPAPVAREENSTVGEGSQDRKVRAAAFFVGGDTEPDPEAYTPDLPGSTQIYTTPSGVVKVALVKSSPEAHEYTGQRWFISERPPGSKVQFLAKNSDAVLSFKPDAPGRYKVGVYGKNDQGEESDSVMTVVDVNEDGSINGPVGFLADDPNAPQDAAAKPPGENEENKEPEEEESADGNLQAVISPESHNRVCDSTWVQLDGTNSGNAKGDQLIYSWSVTSEKFEKGLLPKPILENADMPRARVFIKDEANTAKPGFKWDVVTIALQVTDGAGNVKQDYAQFSPSNFVARISISEILEPNGWVSKGFTERYKSPEEQAANVFCEFKATEISSDHSVSIAKRVSEFDIAEGTLSVPFEKALKRYRDYKVRYRCYSPADLSYQPKDPRGGTTSDGFSSGSITFKSCQNL